MNFYNEFDPKAAAWLRELIAQNLIPRGVVDERSITEIQPYELTAFTQCHFFAGIGGWSLALRLAEWPADRPVWTGSCPCQPFSAAGKGKGSADARHLWPAFFRLIEACRPPVIFGEQVASAAVVGSSAKPTRRKPLSTPEQVWLDGVFADLESAHYACGAGDLPAAGIGAPHIRQRVFWVADSLNRRPQNGWAKNDGAHSCCDSKRNGNSADVPTTPEHSTTRGMADARHEPARRGTRPGEAQGGRALGDATGCGNFSWLEHAPCDGREQRRSESSGRGAAGGCGLGGVGDALREGRAGQPLGLVGASHQGDWSDFDLLACTDGKARRVESGTFPLAHGIPGRVGLLRGYGNAIVPQVAAEFIRAYLEVTA